MLNELHKKILSFQAVKVQRTCLIFHNDFLSILNTGLLINPGSYSPKIHNNSLFSHFKLHPAKVQKK